MCLAVPMAVVAVDGDEVVVDRDGVRQRARCDLLDVVQVGDHVIVHAGYALEVLDEADARATLALIANLAAEDAALLATGEADHA